jgi:hemerythrin
MALTMEWDEKYAVGHERIDFEHRIFPGLIREVSDADEQTDKDMGLRLPLEVKKYAEFHFVSEENIMQKIAYPDFAEHENEHRILLARLDDKLHAYRSDKIGLHDVSDFLFEWFALHTTQTDKKIVSYLATANLPH